MSKLQVVAFVAITCLLHTAVGHRERWPIPLDGGSSESGSQDDSPSSSGELPRFKIRQEENWPSHWRGFQVNRQSRIQSKKSPPVLPVVPVDPLVEEGEEQPQEGGAWSGWQPSDDKIRDVVHKLHAKIQSTACANLPCRITRQRIFIDILRYRSQPVAGTNYHAIVKLGRHIFEILIFSQPWTETLELQGVKGPIKTEEGNANVDPAVPDIDGGDTVIPPPKPSALPPPLPSIKPSPVSKPPPVDDKKPNKLGAPSYLIDADDHVRGLVRVLETKIRRLACENRQCSDPRLGVPPVKAVSYRVQVVAGNLYFVRVLVGELQFTAKIIEQPWLKRIHLESVHGPFKRTQ